MHKISIENAQPLPLSPDEALRAKAWDNAVHAEATRSVFEKRSKKLERLTSWRDFTGIAVPLGIAYIYGSEQFDVLKQFKSFFLALLAFMAFSQLLMSLLSIIRKWDSELAYDIRASRDQYLLRGRWTRIGEGNTANLALEFDQAMRQQEQYESHDAEKGITQQEKQDSLRAGLFFFKRACVCGTVPDSLEKPLFSWKRCEHCGSPIRKTK